MNALHYIFAFLVVTGTLVVFHELGHYWVARLCGVKVLRFSVGMGKIIFSRRFGPDQTEWAISILPLGGYVKMLDARDPDLDLKDMSPQELKREFTRQSVWRRIAIVAAGPVANFILAIAVFSGLYMLGNPEPVPKLRAVSEKTVAYQAGLRGGELITAVNGEPIQLWSDLRWKLLQLALEKSPAKLDVQRPDPAVAGGKLLATVKIPTDSLSAKDLEGDFLTPLGIELGRPKAVLGEITPGGPAMQAGLRKGDIILEANGVPLADGLAFVELVSASAGKPLKLSGMRDQQAFSVIATPAATTVKGKTIGRIQVELPLAPEMIIVSDAPPAAIAKGIRRTWDTSVMTLKMLGKMITGEVSWKNITGPITIADYAGQSAKIGIVSFLSFIAFISISLGIMNLLPIPVLDGGLLLYYSLEVLTGRPVSQRVEEIGQRAGFGILMTLMAVALFNDIARLLT
ncbi:RIP metalloprotease RseP [soil metagenome]